jgi:ribose-phosphate pyrophosphokinase
VDDEVLTGSTLLQGAELLLERRARGVCAACTHALLPDSASQRLHESPIEELVVTDSVPLTPQKQLEKITVLSLAPLIGEAISRIHTGKSVGELFQ